MIDGILAERERKESCGVQKELWCGNIRIEEDKMREVMFERLYNLANALSIVDVHSVYGEFLVRVDFLPSIFLQFHPEGKTGNKFLCPFRANGIDMKIE